VGSRAAKFISRTGKVILEMNTVFRNWRTGTVLRIWVGFSIKNVDFVPVLLKICSFS
jgi:hypothetical protein